MPARTLNDFFAGFFVVKSELTCRLTWQIHGKKFKKKYKESWLKVIGKKKRR